MNEIPTTILYLAYLGERAVMATAWLLGLAVLAFAAAIGYLVIRSAVSKGDSYQPPYVLPEVRGYEYRPLNRIYGRDWGRIGQLVVNAVLALVIALSVTMMAMTVWSRITGRW